MISSPTALRAAVAIFVCAVFLPGCRRTPRQEYERRLRETGGPGRHAVHSDWLLRIMRDLRSWSAERLPQELEPEEMRQRRVDEIADVAAAMAETARRIPDVLDEVDLGPEHQREFMELTREFRGRCLELHQEAPRLSVTEITRRLDEIRESCDSCHRRFRVLPALPPPGDPVSGVR